MPARFALDIAPRLAKLVAHETLAAELAESELAVLAAALENAASGAAPAVASQVLDVVARLLLHPAATDAVCSLFRPLLIDLAARWLVLAPHAYRPSARSEPAHTTPARPSPKHTLDGASPAASGTAAASASLFVEHLAIAFARLLPVAPQIRAHAIAAFSNSASVLDIVRELAAQPFSTEIAARVAELVKSVFRLVDLDAALFTTLWSPEPLYALLEYQDPAVRAYAAQTLSVFVGMSDAERTELLRMHVDPTSPLVLLRIAEQAEVEQRLAEMLYQDPIEPQSEPASGGPMKPRIVVDSSCLSPLTVDLCGVLLPHSTLTTASLHSDSGSLPLNLATMSSLHPSAPAPLVLTESTAANLHRIALAISLGHPVLLQGPPGAGKTALVEQASRMIGSPDLLKIHLGDQTDSKLLLGTYMTTSTPGSFKWQPGVLTTAVSEGKWILIEDIDLAPVDVVAVLVPLLETRWLHVPSRGERIRAKDSFRIFATRRTTTGTGAARPSRSSSSQKHLGESLWNTLEVAELAEAELRQIVLESFPTLAGCADDIMRSYATLRAHFKETPMVGRQLSSRDLFKWCRRVNSLHEHELAAALGRAEIPLDRQRESLFREAFDCFMAMIPRHDVRQHLTLRLGETLSIPQHRVEFYLDNFVPNVAPDAATGSLVCGRVVLPIFDQKLAKAARSPFAMTSPSQRLLERLAVSVSLLEPVLLVGETGTGKTTVVQHLAGQVGTKLVVINMSQQSDSTDLLGGFKPVDALLLATKVKDEFEDLFARTFSVKNNTTFLASVRKAYSKRNWHQLVVGFGRAIAMAKEILAKRRAATAEPEVAESHAESANPPAKRKKRKQLDPELENDWAVFEASSSQLSAQLEQIKNNFLFSFVEGTLVKALRNGHWILLDEVNLATAETLECLSGLLQSSDGSVLLLERGDTTPIRRHPNFRLFACMNPANDAGKRDLPPGLRSRFTEFWVDAPDAVQADLLLIIRSYLFEHLPPGPAGDRICLDVAEFYAAAKAMAAQGVLFDGADQRVHISMRTLTRALSYAVQIAPVYGIRRALYEGTYMTFMTGLGVESWRKMLDLLRQHILSGVRNPDAFVRQVPKHPGQQDDLADLPEDVLRDSPFTLIDCFWVEKGELPIPENLDSTFVLTPSVRSNLTNLARAVLSRKYPVLIQGPTSAGKTSMVEYLAKRTGHRFLRINNHEHTDIQEYLGGYVSNEQGALVFRDLIPCMLPLARSLQGVLVEALRHGYWIVLDELNLAPSDVLEALNRLLDDNRELFLPETQETIKPHPHFMLFATQNPAGQYGGRKQLSRAFRNRFLELHFSDIPEGELETILERRCRIAPSYAKKLVGVYKSLQKLRNTSRIFDGRQSFVTLRDLFRWALRGAASYQKLAEDGYMLLAERVRKPEDRVAIKRILERELKAKIDEVAMYDAAFEQLSATLDLHAAADPAMAKLLAGVVWTGAMRRLFVAVYTCVQFAEPVLLVGETGCGKTTICQILAALVGRRLHIVNAHQNSETADFLGSQRPVRGREQADAEFRAAVRELAALAAASGIQASGLDEDDIASAKAGSLMERIEALSSLTEPLDEATRTALRERIAAALALGQKARALFTWADGPLVQAMKQGDFFLLDEISLADDSVLERLNSVLEPQRLLVLAENSANEVQEIIAADEFKIFATMNPGGDYGKKELSPALRNRFTELWVPSVSSREDLLLILAKKLESAQMKRAESQRWGGRILDFLFWLADRLDKPVEAIISLRDLLAWVGFMRTTAPAVGIPNAFFHGGCMVIVDGMSINPLLGTMGAAAERLSTQSRAMLRGLADGADCASLASAVATAGAEAVPEFDLDASPLVVGDGRFGAGQFFVRLGTAQTKAAGFAMQAPTTLSNCMRVLRALQLAKPILLEGSPGVGKTSLISSLAAVTCHRLVRINLSEQTDLMDLFGSDLPVEGGSGGEFAWRDGPFLKAMQDGDWVLLDELNLASQQVLEGLNACLDHRATIYIPELDRSVACHPDFRVFAAQNPQHEGGGRKGLPKSFVNRFSQVYVSALDMHDLRFICANLYPHLDSALCDKMIAFNERIREETTVKCSFGWRGAPWEFNLRDVLRWIDLWQTSNAGREAYHTEPGDFLEMLYTQRMRTRADRDRVRGIFADVFGALPDRAKRRPAFRLSPSLFQVGTAQLPRVSLRGTHKYGVPALNLQILPSSLPFLESLVQCVQTRSLPLLVGPTASGKSSLVRLLASIAGQTLHEISLNPGVDALELLGGFEQVDLVRRGQEIADAAESALNSVIACGLLRPDVVSPRTLAQAQAAWAAFCKLHSSASQEAAFVELARLVADLEQLARALGMPTERFSEVKDAMVAFDRLASTGVRGQFEWMDSALVRALQHGEWVLIDNVNLCSASVLDRLNPLVEVNGSVAISERGLVDGDIKIIKPHANFRLFMAMDPVFGEVSRAMRNRAVEIYVDDFDTTGDTRILSTAKLMSSIGVPGSLLASELVRADAEDGDSAGDGTSLDTRRPISLAHVVAEQLQRGHSFRDAVEFGLGPHGLSDAHGMVESAADIPSVLRYPTCWPLFVSGKLSVQDSTLAILCITAASLAVHSIAASDPASTNREAVFASPLSRLELLHPRPRHADLLNAAIDAFLQAATPADAHIRSQWLAFWAEILASRFGAEAPAVTVAALSGAELARAGIPRLASAAFPADLTLSGLPRFASNPSLAMAGALIELDRCLCRNEMAESAAYADAQSRTLKGMSVAQLSYAVHHGSLSNASLPHPSIAAVYPLLAAARLACAGVLSLPIDSIPPEAVANLQSLIVCRDALWESVQTPQHDIAKLVVCVKRMSKLLSSSLLGLLEPETAERISEAIRVAWDTLSIEKIKALGVLWKLGGITTVRSPALLAISDKLLEVSSALATSKQGPAQWIFRKTLARDGRDIKRAVVEGFATLHYLNEEEVPNAELVALLESVPGLASITMWPFMDSWAMAIEQSMIEGMFAVLRGDSVDDRRLAASIRSFIDKALEHTSFSPLHFEPLQRLAWFLDGADGAARSVRVAEVSRKQFVHTIIQEALYQSFKAFWSNSFGFWHVPSCDESETLMMHGQVLKLLELEAEKAGHTLAMLDSVQRVPVYACESKVAQMRALLRHTASLDFEAVHRSKLDPHVLMAVIEQFFAAHMELYSPDSMVEINNGIKALFAAHSASAARNAAEALKLAVCDAGSRRLVSIARRLLSPMFDAVAAFCAGAESHGEDGGVADFGRAWTFYALAFLEVYIPDMPIDPVAMRAAKLAMAERDTDRIRARALVAADQEFVVSGNASNDAIAGMTSDLQAIFAKMAKWRARLPVRPPRSQMVDIVGELLQVKQNVLRVETIEQLLAALVRDGAAPSDVLDQEQTLQGVVQSVIDRIETKYPLYRDLLQPACTALYQLKYGVRLVRHAGSRRRLRDVSGFISPLVRFVQGFDLAQLDAVLEHATLVRANSTRAMQTKLDVQLATIEQLVAFLSSGVRMTAGVVERMHALFDAVVDLWDDAEKQRQREEQEKESIYVMQTTAILTDDEREEQEFRERFPDFFDTFADLVPADVLNDAPGAKDAKDAESDAAKPKQAASPPQLPAFDDARMSRVAESHSAAIKAASAPDPSKFAKQWSAAFQASLSAAVSVCSLDGIAVPPSMDQVGRLGFVFASSAHLARFSGNDISTLETYDFYNDSNVAEAQQIQPLLMRFDTRMNELLAQWPDHDVLIHLSTICRRIASFPVVSPLMKLLTGLELLLTHSQDWEAYASKEVSLKAQLDEIVALIVRWRRLELNTWRQLLALEDRRSSAKAGKLWFHLWRTILGILRNPAPAEVRSNAQLAIYEDRTRDPLLEGLLKTLDDLCLSSSIGQFEARLRMLRSFHAHLELLGRVCEPNAFANLRIVTDMTWNVAAYYSQFAPSVEAALATARKPILKELKEYVKIATWKDVNVFALKESAKRTHHHLNKFVKKYKLSLDAPVKEVVASFQESPPPLPAAAAGQTSAIAPEFLWDLAQASASQACVTALTVPATLQDASALENLVRQACAHSEQSAGGRIDDAGRLLARMKRLSTAVVTESAFAPVAIGVEDLAATVLGRVKAFRDANATIGSDEKAAKSQKSQRKKALVDLLRHLAVLGLSQRCRHRFAYHQDSFMINTRSRLELPAAVELAASLSGSAWMHAELRALAERVHVYHFRNLARIAAARSAALSVPPDLTPLEVDRSLSFLENLLHFAFDERHRLAGFASALSELRDFALQLRRLTGRREAALAPGRAAASRLARAKRAVDNAVVAVMQASSVADLASQQGHHIGQAPVERLAGLGSRLAAVKSVLDADSALILGTRMAPIVNLQEPREQTAAGALQHARADLVAIQADFPDAGLFVRDAIAVVQSGVESLSTALLDSPSTQESQSEPARAHALLQCADTVVERLLVAFQHLRTPIEPTLSQKDASPEQPAPDTEGENGADEFGLNPGHLDMAHKLAQTIFETKAMDLLVSSVRDLLEKVDAALAADASSAAAMPAQLPVLLGHLEPLFVQFFVLAQFRLLQYLSYAKAVSKLTYILANLFASLFKEGFCLPKTGDNDGEDGDGGLDDNVQGTGIGEGDGKKDVSDEIENEDQVEGTQNEKPKPPEPQKKIEDEDDGIEMSNDFDGVLEDVEGDDQDQDDEPEGDDEENQMDEQMGDLDQDLADVVDEKLWGDDDQDDDKGNGGDDEKTERDATVDAGSAEVETVAKEQPDGDDKQEDAKKEKEKAKGDQKQKPRDKPEADEGEDDDAHADDKNDPERVNEDAPDKYEDSHSVDVKKADDLDQDDGDDSDDADAENQSSDKDEDGEGLPDGMEVDDDDGDERDEAGPEERDQDGMDVDAASEDDSQPDGPEDDVPRDNEMLDRTSEDEAEETQPDEPQDAEQERADTALAEDGNDPGKTEGDEAPEEDNPEQPQRTAAERNLNDQQRPSIQPFGIQGEQGTEAVQGEDAVGEDDAKMDGEDGQTRQTLDAQAKPSARPDMADDGEEHRPQQPPQQQGSQADSNPRRSVGDAMKQWLNRLKRIADSTDQAERNADESMSERKPDVTGNEQFEFIENDADAKEDAQALGNATDEQLAQMDRQALADEQREGEYQQDETPMDVDAGHKDEAEDKLQSENKDQQPRGASASLSLKQQQPSLLDNNKGSEGASDESDADMSDDEAAKQELEPARAKDDSRMNLALTGRNRNEDADGMDDDTNEHAGSLDSDDAAPVDYAALRQELDAQMALWRQSGGDQRRVQELWRGFVNLTRELAFSLCEQLRLILEPTLATKLKGDYRTGKRLNMRKVISYVASQFKKDKIWLRRTKPSKRTYQVMVAVDDSRSMSESRSVQLAFESLAMISKALTQLEVGEISIVRFGDGVQLVHPFEKPFTDDSGADLIRSFTFQQDRTNVKQMMEATLSILEHARASQSHSSADLWQLQLVISDGICEDHELVRALVRKAAEERIMVVFVVLDNRAEKDSILNMTNVSYDVDPATQRPTLKLNRYMDTFPFDYYVVVRDIERMPEVLAETLRQFFMFVSG
nr:hypothetical protein HK105_001196 [Polyrhizophydium stewartii]